jgi:hypothetical protein
MTMRFPPANPNLTTVGEWLRYRFPVRVHVDPWVSASALYPTHWRITLRLFWVLQIEINRPFRRLGVDPWWIRRTER